MIAVVAVYVVVLVMVIFIVVVIKIMVVTAFSWLLATYELSRVNFCLKCIEWCEPCKYFNWPKEHKLYFSYSFI